MFSSLAGRAVGVGVGVIVGVSDTETGSSVCFAESEETISGSGVGDRESRKPEGSAFVMRVPVGDGADVGVGERDPSLSDILCSLRMPIIPRIAAIKQIFNRSKKQDLFFFIVFLIFPSKFDFTDM